MRPDEVGFDVCSVAKSELPRGKEERSHENKEENESAFCSSIQGRRLGFLVLRSPQSVNALVHMRALYGRYAEEFNVFWFEGREKVLFFLVKEEANVHF